MDLDLGALGLAPEALDVALKLLDWTLGLWGFGFAFEAFGVWI